MNKPRDDTAIRVQAQQATLFALLKSGVPTAGKETAWKALTEATARTLAVQRVSIWALSMDHERLVLEDLYDLRSARHSKGTELDAGRYPAYFQALRWSRAIVAPDAADDARTKEFAPGYGARPRGAAKRAPAARGVRGDRRESRVNFPRTRRFVLRLRARNKCG